MPFLAADSTGGAFIRWWFYGGAPDHALYSRYHLYGIKDGDKQYKVQVITPVSLSIPTSERYVQSSRQLVTKERPFAMRIVYVTSALLTMLQLTWLAMVGLLAWLHRDRLAGLRARIVERLTRTPDPTAAPVVDAAPPF